MPVLFTSASARCHCTRHLSNRKALRLWRAAFQDPCAKQWVCLLLFGIKFLLQEPTTWIVKFFPTSKNICSFSKFSRRPSPLPYHKASLFSKAAFLIVHHHHLLVCCRAAWITESCRASSPFSSRPSTKFKHPDLERGLLNSFPAFFNTLQLPALGGNQAAVRNASFC